MTVRVGEGVASYLSGPSTDLYLSVPGRPLRGMRARSMTEWVGELDAMAVDVTDAMLRETGLVQPPTVQLLSHEFPPPALAGPDLVAPVLPRR